MNTGLFEYKLGARLIWDVSFLMFAFLLLMLVVGCYDHVRKRMHDKVWKREFLLELARDQAAAAALQQSEGNSDLTPYDDAELSPLSVDREGPFDDVET